MDVFNIGGIKYRLVAAIAWSVQVLWLKAVLTHAEHKKFRLRTFQNPGEAGEMPT